MRKAFIIAFIKQQLKRHDINKRFFIDIITPDIFDNILDIIENTCGTITRHDYSTILEYLRK